jgi:putative Mg2+ transporter-C (MgtC) family protein
VREAGIEATWEGSAALLSDYDWLLRLLAAVGVGLAIGLDRDLNGKPIGMRTLALVSLGAALVALAAIPFHGLVEHPDALSRVVQGVLQGVLTGIGFIGAGVILHDKNSRMVHGLTTAATVWVTAALGIACALAAWPLVLTGTALTLIILFGLPCLERLIFPSGKPNQD